MNFHDLRRRLALPLLTLAAFFVSHVALAAPTITATKDDSFAPTTKKNPGDTIPYTITISNGGHLYFARPAGAIHRHRRWEEWWRRHSPG